jgi:hypothetical protein
MLQVFIDDSGWDGSSPVFVLAGYIAPEKQWEEFSDEWQEVLDLPEPNPIPFLKGVEAYSLDNHNRPFFGWTAEQRDARLGKFVSVINNRVTNAIVSVVPIEPYRKLFRGKFTAEQLDRPYFFSFFGMIVRLVKIAKSLGETGPIDIIFDTLGGESKAFMIDQYEKFLQVTPEEFRSYCPPLPKFENEQDFKPLQAADLLAWHVRRHYFEREVLNKDPTLEPSNIHLVKLLSRPDDPFIIWEDHQLADAARALFASSVRPVEGKRMTLPDPTSRSWR